MPEEPVLTKNNLQQPWQMEIISSLHKNFESLKQKNPRYSLRAYAKKLSISPSALSELLRGKKRWTLSPQRGVALLAKLDVSQEARNRLLVAMREIPQHDTRTLSKPDHDIFLDWSHLPILFTFDLPSQFHTPSTIAKRLGLSVSKVRFTINQFVERGFLMRKEDGTLVRPQVFLKSTDGIPSTVVKKGHVANIELTHRALHEIPFNRRDFTSLTFAGSEKKLDLLRQEIRALHQRASSIMNDSDDNDHVFKLNIQLFPTEFK